MTNNPSRPEAGGILLVDDDAGAIQVLRGILAGLGRQRFAMNGRDALRVALECTPDLILLDAEMPGISGIQVLELLKAEPQLIDVPVIFLTGRTEAEFEVSALDQGAVDFIAKPIRAARVLARVKTHLRMKRMADELRRAATMDALTGVFNRRLFDESLDREWHRARRTFEAVSVLLVDVDHFKLYNDRYGHPQGDDCLRHVAQALAASCRRPADLVARYGGEEFIALLPQTPREGAERVGHRMLDTLTALDLPHEAVPRRRVSISIGIASHDAASPWWHDPPVHCTPGNLVLAADQALYHAKRAGRARAHSNDIAAVEPAATTSDGRVHYG